MTHTISVLVANKFGVLARVAGLFSGRGYNIASLTVNPTMDSNVSKMTIVTNGDDAVLEQIDKQLRKLVDVIEVQDLTGGNFIEREIALFKIAAETPEQKHRVISLIELFAGKFVCVSPESIGVEITGSSVKIDDFIKMLNGWTVLEMARSGRVAIEKN